MNAQPAAPAPQAHPADSASQAQPATPNPADSDPNAGTDAGIVQPVQPAQPVPQPSLNSRTSVPDPDGDIVHPDPLPPGVVGEGATIRVHLLGRLSTIDSVQGDPFRGTVASDVVEGGQVLIPTGSQIEGHVVDVSSGHLGGRGSMRLRPETVTLPNGTQYRLVAYVAGAPGAHARVDREGTIGAEARIKRGAIEYGGAMGAGAIAGASIGGGAGALAGTLIGAGAVTLHLMLSHPQATLEPGSVLLFTLTQPLNLVANPTTATSQAPANNN
jgi:hypothetical protein